MTGESGALLVVDDEQFLREAVATLLSSLGFTVAAAGTGTEALRLARTRRFDLLILDVMLPDLDGFEIVRRLRRDRNAVPVIFLTAKDTREDKVAGLSMLPALTKLGYSAPGQYDIAWLPARGKPLSLQMPLDGDEGAFISAAARSVAQPGFSTVPVAGQLTLLEHWSFPGGLAVVGTSLAEVTSTRVQFERIVVIGSAVVLLLIGAGVFLVLRLGLRPVEVMARQADRITAGNLADRVAPRNPRSEVGRLGAALNGMLTGSGWPSRPRSPPRTAAPPRPRRRPRTASA